MNKYVVIIGAAVIIFIGVILILYFWLSKPSADYVWKKLNDKETTSSIVFNENGETKIAINEDKYMPLASTVKIVVALEYAYQVEEGKLNVDEPISIETLDKYYVPKLDGGAHEAWLEYVEKNGMMQNKAVPLREVARGMITFSSNANTEFIMRELGIEQIESRMKELNIEEHTPLFYFTSALFIPYEFKTTDYPNQSMKDAKESIVQTMRDMDDKEWVSLSNTINKKLTKDANYKNEAKITEWWDTDFDTIFSDAFIKSTTLTYAEIMAMINNEELPTIAQEEMEYLLGILMENEANQEWLARAGKKGGSTQYILTDASFIEDKQGNKFELVVFFNDLKWFEGWKLGRSLNEFELKLFQDESFRNDVSE